MQTETEPLYPNATLPLKDSYAVNSIPMSSATPTQQVVAATPAVPVGPSNTVTTCPFCYASIKTAVRHTVTNRTHLTALLCCMFCCCSCLPYCMDSTRNTDHYCPSCNKYLGTYDK